MKAPIDAHFVLRIAAAFMIAASLLHARSAPGQPPFAIDGSLDSPCRLPRDLWNPVVLFAGISVSTAASPQEVLASFPEEWMGRPRLRVGAGVRPPGLQLSFEHPTESIRLTIVYDVAERLAFDPDLSKPVQVDTVRVTWYPMEGGAVGGGTYFGTGCGFFEIEVQDEVMVTGEATVNLVAIYAAPGDTVEVWGTEVGIPDLELRDTRRSIPLLVEPATWGLIKARFR